jgi:hypothetical protein
VENKFRKGRIIMFTILGLIFLAIGTGVLFGTLDYAAVSRIKEEEEAQMSFRVDYDFLKNYNLLCVITNNQSIFRFSGSSRCTLGTNRIIFVWNLFLCSSLLFP